MSMKSMSSPRRVYLRSGTPLVCYGGLYFGRSVGTSQISTEKPVRIEVRERSHGKARITVTQGELTENWTEQSIAFGSR